MPSTFIFGCLELKRRTCEIPFPKSIVYSDVVLDKGVVSQLRKQIKCSLTPKIFSHVTHATLVLGVHFKHYRFTSI